MDKIVWENHYVYSNSALSKAIEFVVRNMDGLLPLYPEERAKLVEYGDQHGIHPQVMLALRNLVKIKLEIKRSSKIGSYAHQIKRRFRQFVGHPQKPMVEFFRETKMPVHQLINLIATTSDFAKLSPEQKTQLRDISRDRIEQERMLRRRDQQFEREFVAWLADHTGAKFKTEDQLKEEGYRLATPDVLFDEPVALVVNGKVHSIRWMDAKNYVLVDFPFVIKGLQKQGDKYNHFYGPGAFVFSRGFDSSVEIPGVYILDGFLITKYGAMHAGAEKANGKSNGGNKLGREQIIEEIKKSNRHTEIKEPKKIDFD